MATKFQIDWLNRPEFKDWIQELPSDVNRAKCSLCHVPFALSNMGTRALRSHAKSMQHQKRLKAMNQSLSLKCFATNQLTANQSTSSTTEVKEAVMEIEAVTSNAPRGLKSFLVVKEAATKAEIFWCMQTVLAHKSARTSEKDVSLFEVMFPDSQIAKGMQLKRTKIGYSLVYGIAPYFKSQLMENISKCKYFSVGFDESLNKVSQRTQMDINIRFWCNEKDMICTRYLTSAFIGRATADDLRLNFKSALSSIPFSSILQISMDGPNVNHKFHRDIKAEVEEAQGADHPVLLNMGTCGLHVLHGAFKTGIKATNWKLLSFLRSIYYLFKDVPARRALFVQLSGSHVFPLKFCPVRWLQNGDVARRAIQLIPHLKNFVSGVVKDKVVINCASY